MQFEENRSGFDVGSSGNAASVPQVRNCLRRENDRSIGHAPPEVLEGVERACAT